MCGCCWQRAAAGNHCTYSFLDLAEFFELLAKRAFFGVPCQASAKSSVRSCLEKRLDRMRS
jgi:hypothetical protein